MAKKRGVASPLGSATDETHQDEIVQRDIKRGFTQFRTLTKTEQLSILKSEMGDGFVSSETFEWELKSGEKRTFRAIDVPFVDLEVKTTVTFEINGREQSLLNETTLSDLDSMEVQQHYPAIGYVTEDGQIDYVDGSRRRMRVILAKGKIPVLKSWVTDQPISAEDARDLAQRLQTAKEHNLWEQGKIAGVYEAKGMKQREIAVAMGISLTKVNRILKAYSVDARIIALFPNVSELSNTDYKTLFKAQEKAICADELDTVLELVKDDFFEKSLNLQIDDGHVVILDFFKEYLKANVVKSDTTKFIDIAEFKEAKKFARKKVDADKRLITYSFQRMSSDFQKKLDQLIKTEIDNELKRKI